MSRSSQAILETSSWPVLLDDDIPILYEDEEEDVGESNPHAWANVILFGCLPTLLARIQPDYQAFSNLNCYYPLEGRRRRKTSRYPNFASDLMIARPFAKMPFDTVSYTIGVDGPAPTTAFEILSKRTALVRDLQEKVELYRKLKIQEYILVDLMGGFLKQRIQLKVLQRNGKWKIKKDADGGLTSQLGFRLIIDDTDPFGYGLFMVDAATGKRCVRPFEAEAQAAVALAAEARAEAQAAAALAAEARAEAQTAATLAAEARAQSAEERNRVLEAELARLRKGKTNS